jgi:hypothetical protein
MILGLDVSTSITGASIVDKYGDLIYCQAWRTDKKGLSFYKKLDIIKENVSVKRGQNSKEIVLKNILESHKNFKAEYTKKGNPVKGTYDRADSVVIAKAGHYLFEEGKQHTCYNKDLNK